MVFSIKVKAKRLTLMAKFENLKTRTKMKTNFTIIVVIIILFASCNANNKSESSDYAATTELTDSAASDAMVEKMIKTADMRFRVKDVQRTKEDLSKILKSDGGLVMEVAINSTIQNTEKVKFSADSLKEITSYRKDGYIVAKIPSNKLDEFTNKVANAAVFVDNQSLKMEDRTLSYLANKMKSDNAKEAVTQIKKASVKKGANVETSLYIKDNDVDRKIENISIDNQVRFSTITLSFYQDNTIKTMIIANDNLYDYKPSFFRRLGLNLIDGLNYFKEFFLFLANFWMFFALGVAAYFGIRYYVRTKRSKVAP